MDKKQFFESLVSLLPDNSGHKLNSFKEIEKIFISLKSGLSDTRLRAEFEQIERDILFHIWMLEQVCNGEDLVGETSLVPGPLIIISFHGEILFANRHYCTASGLSPQEIQERAKEGTLYSHVYEGADMERAEEGISRLEVGKGYKNLELIMRHSGKKISWNSYGGVGEFLEIRSGRELNGENNQIKEEDRFYRGSVMNTSRLIENLYQVSIHGIMSAEDEKRLVWMQEFLSMFDFLWNHSEFFMEMINMPTTKQGKIYGLYNTIYAQFFKYSFSEKKRFKDILTMAHCGSVIEFLENRKFKEVPTGGEYIFHQYNKRPVAKVYWQYCTYPYMTIPGYNKVFSVGTCVQKIQKRNIFVRIFQSIFGKK